jgi:predicted GIY-YIG superfamily endonuclease
VHSELADDRSSAQRREAAIKRLPVSLKRSLIQAGK